MTLERVEGLPSTWCLISMDVCGQTIFSCVRQKLIQIRMRIELGQVSWPEANSSSTDVGLLSRTAVRVQITCYALLTRVIVLQTCGDFV